MDCAIDRTEWNAECKLYSTKTRNNKMRRTESRICRVCPVCCYAFTCCLSALIIINYSICEHLEETKARLCVWADENRLDFQFANFTLAIELSRHSHSERDWAGAQLNLTATRGNDLSSRADPEFAEQLAANPIAARKHPTFRPKPRAVPVPSAAHRRDANGTKRIHFIIASAEISILVPRRLG